MLGDVAKLHEKLSSRLAPLGRKGHSASVVPLGGQPRVLIFGGAPAGRRGLSNALYSVDLAQLSAGQGTWERHRPTGAAPAPRQGHSLTAVAGGKLLVLFGGVAENGELLGDIQVRGRRLFRASYIQGTVIVGLNASLGGLNVGLACPWCCYGGTIPCLPAGLRRPVACTRRRIYDKTRHARVPTTLPAQALLRVFNVLT